MKLALPKLTKKKIIGIVAVILVVALLLVWVLGSCGGSDAAQASAEYEPFTVERGDITVSVTGSGTVEPIEQYEIQSIVTGDIIEDYVTVGTDVQKDQLLYVIDSESAQNSIERSQTSYEQQLISYNEKVKDYNEAQSNRTVYAPVTGVITELYVENGDKVNAGAKLCEISNSDYLTVRVPFLSANAKDIYLNQAATVYFDDRNESHTGYVSHVTTGTYATESGAVVSDIEITFKNPGAILPGENVTATVGNYACNDYGTVKEAAVETVTAEVAGDIENLAYAKGDRITGGKLLLNITDDSSTSDLRSSELSLKNSRLSLDDQIERLDDYTIESPISGTVISKTMKEGDTLDGNKSSLAIVADMSKLTFDISVDELYIQSIEVGQTVTVTADALPDKVFEGVVDTVSIIGTPTSGVTVYPVTVVISEYEGLLPGMNVDAEIVISNASDVLMIPVNSVSRGNLVLVKEDSDISGITVDDMIKNAPHGPENAQPEDNSAAEAEQPADGATPSEGRQRPDGTTPSEGRQRPDGTTPSEGRQRPDGAITSEGRQRPDGAITSEGRQRPDGAITSEGRQRPDGMTSQEGRAPITSDTDSPDTSATDKKAEDAEAPSAERGNTRQMRMPEAPEGYKYVIVETGVANDDYVEVVSGLSEGDVIYVTVIKNTSTTGQTGFGIGGMRSGGMSGMPSGAPGGMSGGMPSGARSGMSGGMPSGARSGMSGGMPSGAMGGMR